MISSATEVVAEPKTYFRASYPFFNKTQPVVELDVLTCNVSLISAKGELKGNQFYYLTDGDEPNSAFKFALIDECITLTRKVTDLWT